MKTSLARRLLALLLAALLPAILCGAAALGEGGKNPSPGVGGEACAHPAALREEAVEVSGCLYEPIEGDRARHTAAQTERVTVICGVCYAPLESYAREGATWTEAHVPGGGTAAEAADPVCTPIEGDASAHTVTETLITSALCARCGAAMGEPVPAQGEARTAPHDYKAVNGEYVCTDCGFVCPHAHTETIEERYSWLESDESGHVVIEHTGVATVCQDCGGVAGVSSGDVRGAVQAHAFERDGLYCDECGFPKDGACAHEAAGNGGEDDWTTSEQYIFLDAGSHERYTESVYAPRCAKCGERLPDMATPARVQCETQPHEYDENGLCACGWYEDGGFAPAGAACRHANVRVESDPGRDGRTACEAYSSRQHLCRGARLDVRLWCGDCGALAARCSRFDPGYTWLEEHWFEEYGGGTACSDCGYAVDCAHENWVLKSRCVEALTTPVDTGSGTHVALASGDEWYECGDCGAGRGKYFDFQLVESSHEDHDCDGFCDGCGARARVCAHRDFSVAGWSLYEETAGIVDDARHRTTLSYHPVILCADCGAEFVDDGNDYADDRLEEAYGAHDGNADGFCAVCGFNMGRAPARP